MKDQKQDERKANFTSSAISALLSNGRKKGEFGKPFTTYVNEKKAEAMFGRSLTNEARATSLDWGNLCESIAHEQLGLEYSLVSKDRFKHATLPWSGMPDGIVNNEKVTDIKCPFTLGSFYNLIQAKSGEDLKRIKPEYYWQLISNAVLTGINTCELILFMPKRSMLDEIRKASQESGKYYFHHKNDFEMPWTSDESGVPTITKIKFEAPEEDKAELIYRVEEATKILNE